VVLQEATRPASVARIAALASMPHYASYAGTSLAFMSRKPVTVAQWNKPRFSRHAFLEVQQEGSHLRVFGLHLSAVHSAWTEHRRTVELRSLLAAIKSHQDGPHVLVGDFNTLAPGELLDITKLPRRLRAMVWLSGGQIRFRTIQKILDAGYADCFRALHPGEPGYSFPTWGPHLRLDFAFVPARDIARVTSCEVQKPAGGDTASDHFPLLTEFL
jgi:endonuclease/exonuclease/phosphatase family metal-dependent hydrolase